MKKGRLEIYLIHYEAENDLELLIFYLCIYVFFYLFIYLVFMCLGMLMEFRGQILKVEYFLQYLGPRARTHVLKPGGKRLYQLAILSACFHLPSVSVALTESLPC